MSDYDGEYDYRGEEESVTNPGEPTLVEGIIKVSVQIDAAKLSRAVADSVAGNISSMIRSAIGNEVTGLLKAKRYYSSNKGEEMSNDLLTVIREVIEQKFNTAYPDVVENKINELADTITKLTLDEHGFRDLPIRNIKDKVLTLVEARLKAAIDPAVKEQVDAIKERVQTQFAQNLMRSLVPLGIKE